MAGVGFLLSDNWPLGLLSLVWGVIIIITYFRVRSKTSLAEKRYLIGMKTIEQANRQHDVDASLN